jgi:hypothetical protein
MTGVITKKVVNILK